MDNVRAYISSLFFTSFTIKLKQCNELQSDSTVTPSFLSLQVCEQQNGFKTIKKGEAAGLNN